MSRKRLRTPEIDRMLDDEAYRRARKDHIDDRIRTKVLARQTGLASGYIANIIAARRRIHEQKIHVSRETPVIVNT